MTIFDYIKDIIVTKRGNLPLDQYVPFFINRWLSFINPDVCNAVSVFNSKQLLENKEMHYKIMLSAFPKLTRCPRINYIKKIKEAPQETDKLAFAVSQKLEISQREAKEILETLSDLFDS